MRQSLMRCSSSSRAISCRSRSFSCVSRILAFQLLAAQLLVNVREKWAREIAWSTEDLTCFGQPLGSASRAAWCGSSIGPSVRYDEESTEAQVKFFRVKELGAVREDRKIAGPAQSIPYPEDAGLTDMFKILRSEHPALSTPEPRAADIDRIVKAFATILDALNPVRNRASGAHPVEAVLEEAEAMLVINGTKTLLQYLDQKLR